MDLFKSTTETRRKELGQRRVACGFVEAKGLRGFVRKFPTGENENTWMTLQCPSQNFRALNP